MKRSFFQAAVTSILLYGCTTWTLTKRLEKKLDGNYTRMLRAILNKSWRQYPTRHQLYGHLPPITKTIQVRWTRHAGHCWRSRDELIRDVLLWIPTHGRAKAGRPARTYIQQLCEDTGCCPEDLPRAMNDREEWLERVRDIRAASTIWWWWWWWKEWIDPFLSFEVSPNYFRPVFKPTPLIPFRTTIKHQHVVFRFRIHALREFKYFSKFFFLNQHKIRFEFTLNLQWKLKWGVIKIWINLPCSINNHNIR